MARPIKDNPYREQLEAIENANGRAFISSPLRPSVRTACIGLAEAAGLLEIFADIADGDLCALYAVARSAPGQLVQTASRIRRKHRGTAPDPLFDPVAPKPRARPEPMPEPSAPEPMPEPETAHSGLTAAEIQWMIERALHGPNEVLASLQADVSDTLAGIPEIVAREAINAVAAIQPLSLIVTLPEQTPVAVGTVHRKTPDIIKALATGVNVYLHGPAGSGKTTAARQCAEAFKLNFYFAAKLESEYLLLGFKDARGETVRTPFREAYEHGGLFLFDELDASAPAAVVALNAALANGICPFPDAIVERHADFKCIAAGNTVLTGASRQYTGRSQLDAASIDRFAFIEFGYDETLELALSTNKDWARHVQAVRAAIAERGLPHLVTPRATIDGGKLLQAGFSWQEAEAMSVYKGLDAATVAQIRSAL